uniref:Epidermal growth factor II n=1 Tax=Pseudocentrotus depressus TaxID=7678 RepID=E2S048_PSEDP|nr:epidermal growth factor II precursor [Pseudocentrotus depressus]
MKVLLAFLVAVIGFSLVTAEGNLEERLKMVLKRLLQGDEDLNLESRDTRRACLRATSNCNDHGECVQDNREEWYCQCEQPYIVGGSQSSCYLPEDEREDLEMETRDTLAACERDTNKCDGNGKCQKSSFGRSYICSCDAGYVSNSYGGCSEADAREIEYLSNIARDVELEMLTRDTLDRCNRDTKNCDGFGQCKKSTFGRTTGQYICKCNEGYRNNLYGGCSPRTEREIEYLSMIARDQELKMQARDTLERCNIDTNNCDGFGECKKSVFGRTNGQFICSCDEGYRNNLYGGCSPKSSDQDEGGEDEREFKLDILRRLANLLAE